MRAQEAGSGLSSSGAFPGQVWAQVPHGQNLLIGLRHGHSTLAWAISRRGSRGVNDFLCFSEADQSGGVMQTAWNNMIRLALQRKPLTAREMPRDGETQWDAEVVAAPVTLRFSARILRGCIHNSGTGYPERDRKERTQRVFGRSTVKQDYCQRQGKTREAQWPPITSCPCSSEGLLYPSGTYNGFTNSGPNHSYLEFDHMGLSWNLKWKTCTYTYRHWYLCVWRWKGGRKAAGGEMVISLLEKTGGAEETSNNTW